MFVPEFVCGMIAMVLIEIVLVIIAVAVHSVRKGRE